MRLLAILLGLVIPLASITLVAGHAALERFDPSPGAVLDEAPARVDGFFTQDIRRQEGASFIQVFDADGNQVDNGAPVIDDEDRRHMYAELQAGLGEGRYLVAYQTLSDEDDELDGSCFLFFVGQAAADEAHQERVRIDAPEDCPIDIEEATVLFGAPEEEEAEGGEAPELQGRVQELEGQVSQLQAALAEAQAEDDDVPVGALIGAAVGAAAAGLVLGGGLVLALRRRA